MTQQKGTLNITDSTVNEMIEARNFTSVEGHVPELISFLLQSAPSLLNTALEVALENAKIREETDKYVRTKSEKIIKEHSPIAHIEQKSLLESNEHLTEVLVNLSKKENKSTEEIQIYLSTLQQIQWNHTRMAENTKDANQRIDIEKERAIHNSKGKSYVVLRGLVSLAQTPEGTKALSNATIYLGKALYRAFIRNY